jgi:beta-glucosidase
MTFDQKFILLHGDLGVDFHTSKKPSGAIGSSGYVPGIPSLGIPALQETDAGMGVTNPLNGRPGDGAVGLPSTLATSATWNIELSYAGSDMVAREARSKGFNVLLAPSVNLAREPRAGRNFEAYGEDPLLTGTMAGYAISAIQSNGLIATLKHVAYNFQETDRNFYNVMIAEAAGRESDLLAFEIAMGLGKPAVVMCGYNRVGTVWSCQNHDLLTRFLRQELKFDGWVMSDWGAVKAPSDANSGLDQEAGAQLDKSVMFGDGLKSAVRAGVVSQQRLDTMNENIVATMARQGMLEKHSSSGQPAIDIKGDTTIARNVEDEAIVLLKNDGNILPLSAQKRLKILVVGGRADFGVLEGGGSSSITPYGAGIRIKADGEGEMGRRYVDYLPGSPLLELRKALPNAEITYTDGRYPSMAATLAHQADVVLIFATQWMVESFDAPDLSLPEGQDQLISAVGAANRNVVVVLETGGAVKMPWLHDVRGVMEAWYPGSGGGAAISDVISGQVNPSGRLPVSFPRREADAPRPTIPGFDKADGAIFDIPLIEGADIGYKWYYKHHSNCLYPFGYGLSYTIFSYFNMNVTHQHDVTVTFRVRNNGRADGKEVSQVYGLFPANDGKREIRLLGWVKSGLRRGEEKNLSVTIDRRLLANYDTKLGRWVIPEENVMLVIGRYAGEAEIQFPLHLQRAEFSSLDMVKPH